MTASPRPLCDCPKPCACYAEGYTAGKDKAYFEVLACLEGTPHAEGCWSAIPCRARQSWAVSTATAPKDRWLIPLIPATGRLAPGGPLHHGAAGSAALPHDRRVRSASPGQSHPADMAGNSPVYSHRLEIPIPHS